MKAIIIDDEPLARMVIKEYLKHYADIEITAECNDGFEGIKAIQQLHPDLIFLDIQMPKINGFEMLELLDEMPSVIFTTAFDEYAVKAFEIHAADYLLKPFSEERFDKAMQKFLEFSTNKSLQTRAVIESATDIMNHQNINRIVLKDGNKIKILAVSQIQYLEAADDYVKIFTAEGSFLKKKTMHFFEQSLDASKFIRIHRSYIVNTQLITRIDNNEKDLHTILLITGSKLPVSKTGYANLKQCLGI